MPTQRCRQDFKFCCSQGRAGVQSRRLRSRPVLTRRQFLQIVAASAGAAVTGTELLSSAADLNRRYQGQLPEKN